MEVSLKVDCLSYAVGKQPPMLVDQSWKKMGVKLMMMMIIE